MRGVLGFVVTLIALTTACGALPDVEHSDGTRLATLENAFATRQRDPTTAADLFAAAGPGATLEAARQRAWFQTLLASDAGSTEWRRFLAATPEPGLAGRAALQLAEVLAAEGEPAAATTVLVGASDSIRSRADLLLLDIADPSAAADAAARLARTAPHLLRGRSPALERAALSGLDQDAWLERAAAWRTAGLGSRGAAELRSRRFRGQEERARRKELARCELDAGSSTRALNALPTRRNADREELLLRAEAYRRQAWGRLPDRSAHRSFSVCLEEAALALSADSERLNTEALTLVLECGTEAGRLDTAFDAWRRLEAAGWRHHRRSWLGRRLGIALAQSGAAAESVHGMAGSLGLHSRCLRYWSALITQDHAAIVELTAAPIRDLYGDWAADSGSRSARYDPPPPTGFADPPATVDWLLTNAGPAEASSEWQRILRGRQPSRSEAVAAADQATRAGQFNTAIRTLRTAFPTIGTVALAETPTDAARAYLPLRYQAHLNAAVRESGLDPWLVAAVARQESTFVAGARSPAGAVGVLQLLPATARLHARALGLGSRPNLTDPEINIRIGARELAHLIRRYRAIEPALAAYNAGERRVRRWWRAWPEPRVFTESIPIPETYNYVRRVVFLADAYRQVHSEAWKETQ